MEVFIFAVYACLLAVFTEAQRQDEGPCFDFPGNSYLHFTPNNFDNDNRIHYTLKFRTTQPAGILMYSKGLHNDDEALYIRDGKLRYQLFNSSPTGVEGYFGGYFAGDERVDTGEWFTVHVYRTWRPPRQRRTARKTGFVMEKNGQRFSHVDYLERDNISLQPTIYFGGYRDELSSVVGNFQGQIKDIREEKNGVVFENPSLNYMSAVGLACLDITPV